MSGSANWSLPINTSNYSLFVGQVKARDEDVALGFDPAYVTPTNILTNTIRWSSAGSKWEKYNGSNWPALAATFNINVATLGGYAAGHSSGQIPVSDGNINTNLNAEKLGGNNSSYYAPLASPTFTGDPKAPTPTYGNNTTSIATTQFVQSALGNVSMIPSGTKMLFYQSAAPTGWTKDGNASLGDIALRVVIDSSGGNVGGAANFSTVFAASRVTDGHTLIAGEIPAHTHGGTTANESTHTHSGSTGGQSQSHSHTYYGLGGTGTRQTVATGGSMTDGTWNTGAASVDHSHSFTTGAGSAHSHTFTTDNGTGGGGAHNHTISNMNIKYANVIVATKN